MSFQTEIIPAKKILSALPTDLKALRFWYRESILPKIRVCAVGDVGLSGRVGILAQKTGYDVLFHDIIPMFKKSDIVFGNLETPLLNTYNGKQLFASSMQVAPALVKTGFTLVNLANNHIYDFGGEGLQSTMDACRDSKMQILGAGKTVEEAKLPIFIDTNGVRVGWLGCGRTLTKQENEGPHYWELNESQLLTSISELRPQVDVLIVSLHLGLMYLDYPHPGHKALAERLQRAGADLVLMHHAHVLQGIQVTEQGRTICYNLGNFIFDWQEGNIKKTIVIREQNDSAIFVFDMDKDGVDQAIAIPTYLDEDLSIRWAIGTRGDEILDRLQRISEDIRGDYTMQFEQQRAERSGPHIIAVVIYNLNKGNWSYFFDQFTRVRFEHLKMFFRFVLNRFFEIIKHL
jgi:hypothetical protein